MLNLWVNRQREAKGYDAIKWKLRTDVMINKESNQKASRQRKALRRLIATESSY